MKTKYQQYPMYSRMVFLYSICIIFVSCITLPIVTNIQFAKVPEQLTFTYNLKQPSGQLILPYSYPLESAIGLTDVNLSNEVTEWYTFVCFVMKQQCNI